MAKFKHTKHRQLWAEVKNSWNWVQKFGLTNAKILIRRMKLNDDRDIPNSCYACEYAVGEQQDNPSRCFRCPLDMEHCTSVKSPFYQMTYAIHEHDKVRFQQLCDIIRDCKVKEGVECE